MLNVLYNESVSDSEIGFMKTELQLDRAMFAYETVCKTEDLKIREAEIRCMEESGDMELLEEYYSEASEEVAEKKEGLLQQAWARIKELFRKLKDMLFGGKQQKKLEEAAEEHTEVSVDEKGNKFLNFLKKVLSTLKTAITYIPKKVLAYYQGDSDSILKKVLKTGAIVAAAGVAVAGVKKKTDDGQNWVVWKTKDLLNIRNQLKDVTNQCVAVIEQESNKPNKDGNKVIQVFQAIKNPVQQWTNTVTGFIEASPAPLLLEDKGGKVAQSNMKLPNYKNAKPPKSKEPMTLAEFRNTASIKDQNKIQKEINRAAKMPRSQRKKLIKGLEKTYNLKLESVMDIEDAIDEGFFQESVRDIADEIVEYSLYEESAYEEDDIFDFELPEFFNESGSDEVDEIADLLSTI